MEINQDRIADTFERRQIRRSMPLTQMSDLQLLDYAYSLTRDWPVQLSAVERADLINVMCMSVQKMKKMETPPSKPRERRHDIHSAAVQPTASAHRQTDVVDVYV